MVSEYGSCSTCGLQSFCKVTFDNDDSRQKTDAARSQKRLARSLCKAGLKSYHSISKHSPPKFISSNHKTNRKSPPICSRDNQICYFKLDLIASLKSKLVFVNCQVWLR